ncbi:hypothetical protein KZI27_15845 [Curtobacterium sp. TC1]|nr:hypothetical protein [Curtobacterium sp. TC1]QZQ54740.1 hypothetical protein KZI27_15845 [Curtobacterium sp. TC1]
MGSIRNISVGLPTKDGHVLLSVRSAVSSTVSARSSRNRQRTPIGSA